MNATLCNTCRENEARYAVTIRDNHGVVIAEGHYCAECVHGVQVIGRGAALDLSGAS